MKTEQSESNSTSNACQAAPSADGGQVFKGTLAALKPFLKKRRPVFRLVSAYRALREGVRGLLNQKRGSKDHIASTLSFLAGSETIRGRPMNITIEPTNFCNLRCPICETGAGKLGRPSGHMSLADFKTIIDKIAPHTNTLMFYFMGEPFLNRDSYDMIRYAKQKGIRFITTCTNGDLVNPDKMVDCGLDEVSFQIGGMTQQTHETYRVNSNLEKVLTNLKESLRVRAEKGSKIRINSGFILMKHNEHEAETFRKTMRELGVDDAVVIDPCVRTMEEGKRYLPTNLDNWFYDPDSFNKGTLKPRFLPPNECPWIYYSLSIHVNGGVVPCCRDPLGENVMGNLITQSLDDVWNGEKYRAFRRQLHEDQGKVGICRLCSSYAPSPIQ